MNFNLGHLLESLPKHTHARFSEFATKPMHQFGYYLPILEADEPELDDDGRLTLKIQSFYQASEYLEAWAKMFMHKQDGYILMDACWIYKPKITVDLYDTLAIKLYVITQEVYDSIPQKACEPQPNLIE